MKLMPTKENILGEIKKVEIAFADLLPTKKVLVTTSAVKIDESQYQEVYVTFSVSKFSI